MTTDQLAANRRFERVRPPRPVIALVSSAGGLEATSAVLAALPAGLGAAVIVLQHLAPDRPSMLPAILGRRTALEVTTAVDGDPLTTGCAVVVPPGRHMLVTPDRRIHLVNTDHFPPPRPSADILLCTLATAVGPDAIAVVLSGNGHDGAIGVQAIHDLGGTVLVQDVTTAAHPAMPLAALHAVDAEEPMPVERIAVRLLDLVAPVRPSSGPSKS